ncbi:hypothetical protein Nmel_018287 [Mimus melanotis]
MSSMPRVGPGASSCSPGAWAGGSGLALGSYSPRGWCSAVPVPMPVRLLREELQLLQEQGSYVGEVVRAMDKKKVLVKVHPEGKFVVDVDKNIDINDVTPNCRVALRNDSYTLHKILPNKVDPLVSLMMVEKVPDSTYEMIGGLDKQIKEIKEVIELPVKHPELFEALGIAQPKASAALGSPRAAPCAQAGSEGPCGRSRGCCSTAPPAQGRPCWPGPWPITRTAPSSACPALSSCRSSSGKVTGQGLALGALGAGWARGQAEPCAPQGPVWCGSCS